MNDVVTVIDQKLQKRYGSTGEDPHDTLMLRRSVKLLNKLLKEFASIKMLGGIKTMSNVRSPFWLNHLTTSTQTNLQLVTSLHPVLYRYYSQMSTNISPSTLTPQTLPSARLYDDILLSHLVYKCIIKMTVWLWNRIDKIPKEEVERNRAWVSNPMI